VALQVADKRSIHSAGAAIFIPRGSEHGFAILSDEARLLTAFTPAGFEGFFRETADATPDDLGRLIATAARYGAEVTGPPIAFDVK
jgi:hypothetical protein